MIDVSIVLPAIRTEKWMAFCQAVTQSAKKTSWEAIFVGPYEAPADVMALGNVKYVKSLSSPVRCIQLGIMEASGEYFSVSCDDGLYIDGAIDKCFDTLNAHGRSEKVIVSGKYMEGHRKRDIKNLSKRTYYAVNASPVTGSVHLPSWLILNLPFVKMDYLRRMGGLDCRFEAQALAMTDLANRLQRDGSTVHLTDDFIMDIVPSGGSGNAGDHGPIYYGQTENDVPLYKSIYNHASCVDRTDIDFDNWKSAPEVWGRRKF